MTLDRVSPFLFLLMWSSGAVFAALGLQYASVSVFLAVRSVGAAALLLLVCIGLFRKAGFLRKVQLAPRELLSVLTIGLLMQVVYQTAYVLALHYQLTPGMLAIVLGLQPVLTPLIARERLPWRGMCCLLAGLIGLVIAVAGAREVGAVTGLGLVFGVVAVLSISTGAVMQKASTVDPLVSALYQTLLAALIFTLGLPFTPLHLEVTVPFVLAAGWMIVVVSVCAVLLLFYLLSRRSASQVAVLFYLVPVLTVAFDYLAFGNTLSTVTGLGAVIVVLAVGGYGRLSRV
ncbi:MULTISPECIES: DMT family transporter [Pseudomonas]|uniref:DMT family transporter n=1 Tax=Pseudomonas quercus TaxID=2722792 RepID=A0ABX0YFP1_9PSED|nr:MULTISPECIES: DMT family transporter [Pseudomonas]MBF7142478.1 DMT family transporter [Pseudomonas sp. LY10J]NJP01016.1 DMT family transporter [Pseudomonas quercus]